MKYLDELQKLADAATPGRWSVGLHIFSNRYRILNCAETIHRLDVTAENVGSDDAAFIAASREAVPKLIQALRVAMDGLNNLSGDVPIEAFDNGHEYSRHIISKIEEILK